MNASSTYYHPILRRLSPQSVSMRRLLVTASMLTILSGCTGFKDSPSCTRIDGLASCDSLSDVNTMSNNGIIAADEDGHVTRGYGGEATSHDPISLPTRALEVNAPPLASTPLRVPERTAHMVIFPFIDEHGNYHDTAHLDILLSKPYWSKPAATVIRHQEDDRL
ncbi:TraV family lipoprotein [Vibrio mediterranei]|uniref:TraV family lipoprotein n=1 Tax=Vibrio mediterranei TaxID=689 RepID=UPI00148D3BF1|nr:TraV family lipoprotein [Vibrio mediterranei]NOI26892.1 TraV family lipoprotein [Vibrio mediterranei]